MKNVIFIIVGLIVLIFIVFYIKNKYFKTKKEEELEQIHNIEQQIQDEREYYNKENCVKIREDWDKCKMYNHLHYL